MSKIYAVLGAGMQGTAAAFDLASHAHPTTILVGDLNEEQAARSAARVNRLVGRNVCQPCPVDAGNRSSLAGFLADANVLLSCVPYWMHPQIAEVAIETRTHMCDLGGNTQVTLQTLELDDRAKAAGVALVPDCGLAPGLVNSIGLWLVEHLDSCHSVKLYCGVLPQTQNPRSITSLHLILRV